MGVKTGPSPGRVRAARLRRFLTLRSGEALARFQIAVRDIVILCKPCAGDTFRSGGLSG